MPVIIAFGYKSRVGKDTAAKLLISALRLSGRFSSVQHVKFADKLKVIAHSLWCWAGLHGWAYYESEAGQLQRDVVLPTLGKTPVELWIELGQAVRNICPDTWVTSALLEASAAGAGAVVVSDLRFPNEADVIHGLGGHCVEITSSRVVEKGSDRYLDGWEGWDAHIRNDGTLNKLNENVLSVAHSFGLL